LVIDILNLIITCFLSLVIAIFCQKMAENNLSVTKENNKQLTFSLPQMHHSEREV